eukprot:363374-Chlamydomonas_euryale.AAC.9
MAHALFCVDRVLWSACEEKQAQPAPPGRTWGCGRAWRAAGAPAAPPVEARSGWPLTTESVEPFADWG